MRSGKMYPARTNDRSEQLMTQTIRDATPADAATIAEFNNLMAKETENRSLDRDVLRDGVSALLHDPGKGRYWIAEMNDRIVGQIMTTYEWSDWRNGMLWWIQSVYVHPDYRRRGVFSSLYRHVESLARSESHVCGIRLYVEANNTRAQDAYASLGMRKPGYEVMEIEFSKRMEQENA